MVGTATLEAFFHHLLNLSIPAPVRIGKGIDGRAQLVFDDGLAIMNFSPHGVLADPGQVGMSQSVSAKADSRRVHGANFLPAQHCAAVKRRDAPVHSFPGGPANRQKHRGRHAVLLQNWERLLIDTVIAVIEGDDKGTFRERLTPSNMC